MTTNPFIRWFKRSPRPALETEGSVVERGTVVEKGMDGEFGGILLDIIDRLHSDHLAKSENSQWHAGAAFAGIELTKELRQCIRRKQDILKARIDKEERDKQPPVDHQWHPVEDDGMTHPSQEPVIIS